MSPTVALGSNWIRSEPDAAGRRRARSVQPMNAEQAESLVRIRPAVLGDVPTILGFIRGLAEYEGETALCVATEEGLRAQLFCSEPLARVLVAEDDDGPAGHAVYLFYFSEYQGRPGLFVQQLFVRPERRGQGIGRALMQRLG